MEGSLEMEITQTVKPLGLTLYSVDRKPGVLRVMLDKRGGVDLERLEEASHLLSAFLDVSDPLHGNPYVLEVSSPGAERKVSNPEQAECAIGLLVSVQLRGKHVDSSANKDTDKKNRSKDAHTDDRDGGSRIYGRLLSVEGSDIIIEQVNSSFPGNAGSGRDGGSKEELNRLRVTLDDDVVVRTVLEWGTKEDV